MSQQCCSLCAKDKPLEKFMKDKQLLRSCEDCRRSKRVRKQALRKAQRAKPESSHGSTKPKESEEAKSPAELPFTELQLRFDPEPQWVESGIESQPEVGDGESLKVEPTTHFGLFAWKTTTMLGQALGPAVAAQRRREQGEHLFSSVLAAE